MVLGIFEIQLVTQDHNAMVSFYEDVVGLRKTIDHDERGRVHFGLGTGQLILACCNKEEVIGDWPGVPPRMYGDGEPTTTGPDCHGPIHFAFHVDNTSWDALIARLEEHDEGCMKGPITWGAGFESLYFKDPDGNVAELIRNI